MHRLLPHLGIFALSLGGLAVSSAYSTEPIMDQVIPPLMATKSAPEVPECSASEACAYPIADAASEASIIIPSVAVNKTVVVPPMRSLDLDARRAADRALQQLSSYQHFSTVESNLVVSSTRRMVTLVSSGDRCKVTVIRLNNDEWAVERSVCSFIPVSTKGSLSKH